MGRKPAYLFLGGPLSSLPGSQVQSGRNEYVNTHSKNLMLFSSKLLGCLLNFNRENEDPGIKKDLQSLPTPKPLKDLENISQKAKFLWEDFFLFSSGQV